MLFGRFDTKTCVLFLELRITPAISKTHTVPPEHGLTVLLLLRLAPCQLALRQFGLGLGQLRIHLLGLQLLQSWIKLKEQLLCADQITFANMNFEYTSHELWGEPRLLGVQKTALGLKLGVHWTAVDRVNNRNRTGLLCSSQSKSEASRQYQA